MSNNKDTLREVLFDVRDRLSNIDKNNVVIMAKLEVIEQEINKIPGIKLKVDNFAIVVTTIADQVMDLWQKFIDFADRTNGRLRLIRPNGNGHGPQEAEEIDS